MCSWIDVGKYAYARGVAVLGQFKCKGRADIQMSYLPGQSSAMMPRLDRQAMNQASPGAGTTPLWLFCRSRVACREWAFR